MVAPKISIIIPVFNAGLYIEQCIRSVLNQTMQDVEIIAVNDGSTDNSATLLDAMASTDHRLQVFHNSNKGVSAARNFGLQQARGMYIGFSDADDWMEPTMLEDLYNAVTTKGCDWAICNVNSIREGQPIKTRLHMTDQVLEVDGNRAGFIHGLMRFHYDNANWNKLFSAAIIRKNQLRFDESMQIWEDLLFNLQYLQYAGKVAVIAKPLYNYRILSTSLFSGNRDNKIPQFNKLYNGYLSFADSYAGASEITAFKAEMARITYSQLLYEAELKVNREQHFFPKVAIAFKQELKRFNPLIFDFSSQERKGLQGIKRQLLQQQQFALFALIIASKPLLRKPYRFVRRLLKK